MMIDQALANGVSVSAWTFDELYGRDGKFLDALQARGQVFVGEIPADFHGWSRKPQLLHERPENTGSGGSGRPKSYPRLAAGYHSSEVRNLARHSPVFRKQSWQTYHIKDTDKGPAVWEVKWAPFWRKDRDGFPTRRHCLIVARNVVTGEVKYFLSNRLPGESNPVTGELVTLRGLLRVAFGRWSIETMFQELTETLTCKVKTLGYPKAAIFAFCLSRVAYNGISLIKAALRSVHGTDTVEENVSGYYLSLEISKTYTGMMIAIPQKHWCVFRDMSVAELASVLEELAQQVNLSKYQKHPRGPKHPLPERIDTGKTNHVSTARILAKRNTAI